MPRQRVDQKDVPELLAELEQAGATHIRRSGVDVRGMVTVRWRASAAETEAYSAALRAWKPVFALSAFLLLVFAILGILISFSR